jgi:hypothetical protein
MNGMVMACISISAPLAALGVYHLQEWLEQWDYNRHVED